MKGPDSDRGFGSKETCNSSKIGMNGGILLINGGDGTSLDYSISDDRRVKRNAETTAGNGLQSIIRAKQSWLVSM